MLRQAQIAQEEGASWLVIGSEMGGRLTSGRPMNGFGQWCDRWRSMIERVRAVAAAALPVSGTPGAALKLSYAAKFSGFWNDEDANEAAAVCFWDQLDLIGMNAYPHMSLAPASSTAAPQARTLPSDLQHAAVFNPLGL